MTAEQLIEEIKRMDPAELAKLLVYLRVVWPPERPGGATPLSECLALVDTPEGRARTAAVLAARPFPHYEAGPRPGLLVRIDRDGTRTVGRFVGREFRAVRVEKRRSVAAVKSAVVSSDRVALRFTSDVQIRFPVAISPRLASASKTDLRNIEVSPYGLHWPASTRTCLLLECLRHPLGWRRRKIGEAAEVALMRRLTQGYDVRILSRITPLGTGVLSYYMHVYVTMEGAPALPFCSGSYRRKCAHLRMLA